MSNNSSSSSITFPSLLALVFVTLKLTGFINWSWWLVLLPIYGPFAVILIVIGGVLVWSLATSSAR